MLYEKDFELFGKSIRVTLERQFDSAYVERFVFPAITVAHNLHHAPKAEKYQLALWKGGCVFWWSHVLAVKVAVPQREAMAWYNRKMEKYNEKLRKMEDKLR